MRHQTKRKYADRKKQSKVSFTKHIEKNKNVNGMASTMGINLQTVSHCWDMFLNYDTDFHRLLFDGVSKDGGLRL